MDPKEEKPKEIMPVASAIIIKKDSEDGDLDKLLLIQRDKDDHFPLMWEVPRGKCDQPNESLIDCLKRETKEETGLDIIPIRYVGKFSYYSVKRKRESIQYNFLCKLKYDNQPVKLSHEHQNYKWVPSMGIVQLNVMPELSKIISSVFNKDIKIFDSPDLPKEIDDKILEYYKIFIGK